MDYSNLKLHSRKTSAKRAFNVSYLGSVNSSSKIQKGRKIGIDTYCLYLAPWKLSGYNTCIQATEDCINSCIFFTGRVKMEKPKIGKIQVSRIKKTKAYYEQRELFLNVLINEIKNAKFAAKRKGHKFAVRLNGTSDIDFTIAKIDGKNIFQHFPRVQFYDYTKVAKRYTRKPKNQHLTFSYTGKNWDKCEALLNDGFNVAVVFSTKKGQNLPSHYKGFEVIDGDITDYRPADKAGSIVGLRFKEIADKAKAQKVKASQFVVSVQ